MAAESVGGPIVPAKTFFWFAGEKYVDNQPQQSTFLVPTAAELTGDFRGVTRSGAQVTIKDPLTGQPFANNMHPRQIGSTRSASPCEIPPAGGHASR